MLSVLISASETAGASPTPEIARYGYRLPVGAAVPLLVLLVALEEAGCVWVFRDAEDFDLRVCFFDLLKKTF